MGKKEPGEVIEGDTCRGSGTTPAKFLHPGPEKDAHSNKASTVREEVTEKTDPHNPPSVEYLTLSRQLFSLLISV
jgi:hypothetical protein